MTGILAVAAGWWLGILSAPFLVAFALAALVFGIFLSVTAVALEEASARRFPRLRQLAGLAALSVLEQLGYRQLQAAWRAKALLDWLGGRKRGHWGEMRRRGLAR